MAQTRTDRPVTPSTERETTGRNARSLKDVMTSNPATVTETETVQNAAELMLRNDCGSLPVTDKSRKLIGVITDRDIVTRLIAKGVNPLESKVSDAMTREAHSVRETHKLDDVFKLMSDKQIRRVPVVNDSNEVIGIIAQADLALDTGDDREVGETVERISEPKQEARP